MRHSVSPPTDSAGVPIADQRTGNMTCCELRWHHGTIDFPSNRADADGATGLFQLLVDRSPKAFQRFAEDYYEVAVDLKAVSGVHALRPLDQKLVSSLNVEVALADLAQDISEIGYPQAD